MIIHTSFDWRYGDDEIVVAASGLLSKAGDITKECASRGPCVLTEAELKSARKMAEAAAEMLCRTKSPGKKS